MEHVSTYLKNLKFDPRLLGGFIATSVAYAEFDGSDAGVISAGDLVNTSLIVYSGHYNVA